MRVVVREWERVVVLRDGRVDRVLAPGRHRFRAARVEIQRVDVRERQYVVPGQEVLTSDSVAVKVSLLVVWQVAEPIPFLTVSDQPLARLHAAVQQALRVRVSARTVDQLLAERDALAAGVVEEVSDAVSGLGLGVASVQVRDLMLPSELRRAAAEVLLAREQGRAELERARSEAAALRSLANPARLLEEHPGLLHLRTLQAAGRGATLVVTPPGLGLPRADPAPPG